MDSKMILLNGPRMSGKNSILNYIFSKYTNQGVDYKDYWFDASCKDVLYKLVQDFFLISEERFWEIYNDRSLKEVPLPEFRITVGNGKTHKLGNIMGIDIDFDDPVRDFVWDIGEYRECQYNLSIREAMIYISEIVMKPLLGQNYFGKARIHQIKSNHTYNMYYDDSSSCFNGDSSELNGLVEHFGEDNILLLRIKGRGSFDGDSRSYHPDGVIKHTVDIINDSTEEAFLDEAFNVIYGFISKF